MLISRQNSLAERLEAPRLGKGLTPRIPLAATSGFRERMRKRDPGDAPDLRPTSRDENRSLAA